MELHEAIRRKIGIVKQVYLQMILQKAINEAREDLEDVGKQCSAETIAVYAEKLKMKQELYEDLLGESYERSKQ